MTPGKESLYLAVICVLIAGIAGLGMKAARDEKAVQRADDEATLQRSRAQTWLDIAAVYHSTGLKKDANAEGWRIIYLGCDAALENYRRIFELPTIPHVPPLRPLDAVEEPHKGESP